MYFFVFAPLLEDKKVINEINFLAFSRLIKKDPGVNQWSGLIRRHLHFPAKPSIPAKEQTDAVITRGEHKT